MSDYIQKIAAAADQLDRAGSRDGAGKLDLVISTVVEARKAIAQYEGGLGYAVRNSRCWSNCYRAKRKDNPYRSAQKVWTECFEEYNDAVAGNTKPWDKYAQNEPAVANAKFAQAVGLRITAGEHPGHAVMAETENSVSTPIMAIAAAGELVNSVANDLPEGELRTALATAADSLRKEAQGFAERAGRWMGGIGGAAAGAGLGLGLGPVGAIGGGAAGALGGGEFGAALGRRVDQIGTSVKGKLNNWMNSGAGSAQDIAAWEKKFKAQVNEFISEHGDDLKPESNGQPSQVGTMLIDTLRQTARKDLVEIGNGPNNNPNVRTYYSWLNSNAFVEWVMKRANGDSSAQVPTAPVISFQDWNTELVSKLDQLLAWNPKAGNPPKDKATGQIDTNSFEYQRGNFVFNEMKNKLDQINDPAAASLKSAFSIDWFFDTLRKRAKAKATPKSPASAAPASGRTTRPATRQMNPTNFPSPTAPPQTVLTPFLPQVAQLSGNQLQAMLQGFQSLLQQAKAVTP